jgi:hypothetical protein
VSSATWAYNQPETLMSPALDVERHRECSFLRWLLYVRS